MQLPFSLDQFLSVFVAYNTAIWPMQIALNLVAVLSIGLCFRAKVPSRSIAAILGILWLWTGVVYHLTFFQSINPAAMAFGGLCIAEAAVFLYAGVIKQTLEFGVSRGWKAYLGGLFLLYGLLVYPVIGHSLGHVYPAAPTFGVPCPTTIFTFGLLLWTRRPVKWYVILIPLIWSCIGFIAATNLGIREDVGLFVAGIVGTVVLLTGRGFERRHATT